jgi:hypothetical protein
MSEIKINMSAVDPLLVMKATAKASENKIDESELKELIQDASKGGLNFDESNFLLGLLDQSNVQKIKGLNQCPVEISFDNTKFSQNDLQFENIKASAMSEKSLELGKAALDSAKKEMSKDIPVVKSRAANVDKYMDHAGVSKGGMWCGAFAGYNLEQTGFKFPEHLASVEKATAFFLYRKYTDNSAAINTKLDQLKSEQSTTGSERQLFFLRGADGKPSNVSDVAKYHLKPDQIENRAFDYTKLPIQVGDTAIFNGHIGMVESYDQKSGKLVLIEGNSGGKTGINRSEYDLSRAEDRAKFTGFGRPAVNDFK